MRVSVLEIYRNLHHVPFAIVQSYEDGDIRVVCLIDTIYMMRHGINVGSTLILRDGLYIVSVEDRSKTHEPQVNYVHTGSDTFSQWFQFKDYFESKIGLKRTLLLFKSGLRTVAEVRRQESSSLLNIKGIGAYGVRLVEQAL